MKSRPPAVSGDIFAGDIRALQVNLGLRCNQHCSGCRIAAEPYNRDTMTSDVIRASLAVLARFAIPSLEITGAAPELHEEFRYLIRVAKVIEARVIVHSNLAALSGHSQECTPGFLRDQGVQLIASLPCNNAISTGTDHFYSCIEGLRRLNGVGYGVHPDLVLNLVYAPREPRPAMMTAVEVEQHYRQEMAAEHGVFFTSLARNRALTNMVCRHMVSVGWDGRLYDCDQNLALSLPVDHGAPDHVADFSLDALNGRQVNAGPQCLVCMGGAVT